MKRKILFITLGGSLLMVGILAAGFWYMSTQPLYKPGMVREGKGLGAPLIPPSQPVGSDSWLVEPGIELAHFAAGTGRDILVVHTTHERTRLVDRRLPISLLRPARLWRIHAPD